VGTNLVVGFFLGVAGFAGHALQLEVDWPVLAVSITDRGAGCLAGSQADWTHVRARCAPVDRGPLIAVACAIAVALLWNGVQLLFEVGAPPRARNPRLAAVVAGSVIGLIGGAVGLILGTLRMPALLGRVGLPAARAVGTNLVVGFFLGVAGFAGHAAQLEVDWPVLGVSIAAAVPGTLLGARLTGRMSERTLKRAIGAALVAVGLAIAVEAAL